MAETLQFHFTPVEEARQGEPNVHAKASTAVADVIEALGKAIPDAVGDTVCYAGEHTVFVDASRIVQVCRYLKEEAGFAYMVDIGGVDRFTETQRFEVYYNLVNVAAGKRIRLKVRVEEEACHCTERDIGLSRCQLERAGVL